MAFCVKCGSENPPDAGYCHKCGHPIYTPVTKPTAQAGVTEPPLLVASPSPDQKPKKPLTKLIIINLLLVWLIEIALIFIIPVFGAMFADFGADLPWPTQCLLDSSNLFKSWWWVLNPLLVVLGVMFFLVYPAARITPRKSLKLAAILLSLQLVAMLVSMFLPIFQLGAVANGVK